LSFEDLLWSDVSEEAFKGLGVSWLLDNNVDFVVVVGKHCALILHHQRQTQNPVFVLGLDSSLGCRFFRLALLGVDLLDVLGRIFWCSSDEEAYLVESFRIGLGLFGFFDQLCEGCDCAVLQPLVVELRDDDWVLQGVL